MDYICIKLNAKRNNSNGAAALKTVCEEMKNIATKIVEAINNVDLEELDMLLKSGVSKQTLEEVIEVFDSKEESIFSFTPFLDENSFRVAKAVENQDGLLENWILEWPINEIVR